MSPALPWLLLLFFKAVCFPKIIPKNWTKAEASAGNLFWLNSPGLGQRLEKTGCDAERPQETRRERRAHSEHCAPCRVLHWAAGYTGASKALPVDGTLWDPVSTTARSGGATAACAAFLEPPPGEEGIAPPFPPPFTDFLRGWHSISVMKYFPMSVSHIGSTSKFPK